MCPGSAHHESLIRQSPHVVSYFFNHSHTEIRVGHLTLIGAALTGWCTFRVSHAAAGSLCSAPADSPLQLTFRCSAGTCSTFCSLSHLTVGRPLQCISIDVTEACMLMKLQRYSISSDHTTVTCVQSNMYLAWMFHTARSITDRSCLVCHYRINAPHLMLPLEDLAECLAEPYAENFLCPTICLLGTLSASYGPEWMHNLSSSGAFHPVHTPDSTTVPVRADILLSSLSTLALWDIPCGRPC